MYAAWKADPQSVHKSWDVYFRYSDAGRDGSSVSPWCWIEGQTSLLESSRALVSCGPCEAVFVRCHAAGGRGGGVRGKPVGTQGTGCGRFALLGLDKPRREDGVIAVPVQENFGSLFRGSVRGVEAHPSVRSPSLTPSRACRAGTSVPDPSERGQSFAKPPRVIEVPSAVAPLESEISDVDGHSDSLGLAYLIRAYQVRVQRAGRVPLRE